MGRQQKMPYKCTGVETYCESCDDWVEVTDMDSDFTILHEKYDVKIFIRVVCGHLQINVHNLNFDHEYAKNLERELNNVES